MRFEVYIIRRQQPELTAAEASLNRKTHALGVQMPVKALPDPVARQQPENLRALIAAVSGRVVQKAELFVIPGCFQACLQPPELAAEDFLPLAGLAGKAVRFTDVTGKDEMTQVVTEFLRA